MDKPTILVVDDEEDIVELVELNLSREGYKVLTCGTGEQALEITHSKLPDLVILDLMLPGIDGLEVCRRLKSHPKTEQIPIIILSAKGEESDIVTGLELGADDYITKPFSGKVMVAESEGSCGKRSRQCWTKRSNKNPLLTIDPSRREVLAKNKPVDLTFTEFNILHILRKATGVGLYKRYQIVDALHGSDYLVTERAVDVQIVSLRKKLGECGEYIETVRGVGYRFKD